MSKKIRFEVIIPSVNLLLQCYIKTVLSVCKQTIFFQIKEGLVPECKLLFIERSSFVKKSNRLNLCISLLTYFQILSPIKLHGIKGNVKLKNIKCYGQSNPGFC